MTRTAAFPTLIGVMACLVILIPLALDGREPAHAATLHWDGVTVSSHTVVKGCVQPGQIVNLPVREGDRVKAGQVLFRLDVAVQEKEVERLRLVAGSDAGVRLAEERSRYLDGEKRRLAKLVGKGMASDADLRDITHRATVARAEADIARLERHTAELRWQEAKARLAQRTGTSPFDGYVTRLIRRQGEVVDKLEPVVEVMRLAPLWIEFDCPVGEACTLEPGARLGVSAAGEGGRPRTARVIHVARNADPASQTCRVRLVLPNTGDRPWQTGLKVRISPAAAGGR